jgi:predicted ATP-grasp superfamily ATP-dependent carboligase
VWLIGIKRSHASKKVNTVEAAERLLLFGASTRAAAFSALRAGLQPWCMDLFADRDLAARCDAAATTGKYPDCFLAALETAPPGPWMYTGGLENHPGLVRAMSLRRELWGNYAPALSRVRNALFVAKALRSAGLHAPAVRQWDPFESRFVSSKDRRWLVKPMRGAGGHGIHFHDEIIVKQFVRAKRHWYLQEFIKGISCAAIYVGDGQVAQLLGMTRQLVGESWCHAGAFQYCGSIGPEAIGGNLAQALRQLGNKLVDLCGLRGIFGIDGILRDGVFFPVEVNPRYTASVEVLEYATGLQALAWHRHVFDESSEPGVLPPIFDGRSFVGKAILMARRDVVIPDDGPWNAVLESPSAIDEMPAYADIPHAGEHIKAGRPIMTLFARADSLAACETSLRGIAAGLDRLLYKS